MPFNASAAGVKSALEELRDIDNVSVTMTTSGATRTYTVTFGGVLAGKNVPLIQAAAMPAVNGAQQGAVDYKYNPAGLLSEGGDSSARYTWAYDQLNRQTSETADLDPANPLNSIVSLTQAFNVAGKRIQLSARFTDFGSGGTVTTRPDFRSVFEYDNLDRLKSIQQTALGGANSNAVAPKFVDFSYNRLGQLTALSRFENTTATGPALRTSWTYDGANRLSQLKHESASGTAATLLNQYSYTYDLMNRITGITSTLDGPSAFSYDRNSQLKTASHPTPRAAELYDYDANGNRTGGAQQVGVNNQTLADDKYTYQYDAEGNRTRRTNKSPNAVDPIEDYAWDHRNRLTKITFRNAAGVETRSIEYRYDLLNRLVLRRLDSNGAATAGGVSDLWLAGYDGINPTLALSSLNSTAITNRYLWGPGVDFLLADEQLTTTSAPGQPLAAGNTLWPLGDHLGTLRDLADFTGGSFTITNHRVFDTFGRLLSETNSSVDSHFAFTGKFFEDLGDTDPTTSLSHHWNRWYDPQSGKWMSEDPIGFAGGDANLGRYVGNFATGGRDWSGFYQDGEAVTPKRPTSLPAEAVFTVQDDIIGIGITVPEGAKGTPTTTAYPDTGLSRGAIGATGFMKDFEKRWKGVNGLDTLGIFNPFGQHNVYRALGNVLFAAMETPAIITDEVHEKVAEELSRETDPVKRWAWQAGGNMTVPANMFLDIGLVAIDDSIQTTTSIGRYLGVIEDAANLPRRTVPAKGGVPRSSTGKGSVPPGQRDPKRVWTKEEKRSVLEERGGTCDQCNSPLSVDIAKGHHVERHADGGKTTIENLAIVCAKCHEWLHGKR